METKQRGMTATYWKLIFDGKVVACFKQSEETPYHRRLRELSGCYRSLSNTEEYKLFLDAQKAILRRNGEHG